MSKAETIQAEIVAEQKEIKIDALLTAIAGVGLVVGVIAQWQEWGAVIAVAMFALTYLTGGLPAAKEALTSLWQERSLNIDLLMVLAALAAAGVGEVRDGAILLFLFSLAGTLEAYAMGSTKRAVAALMSLHPDTALRKNADGGTTSVAVSELSIGDVVVVRPGDRVPVDGEVVEGTGSVDQSPITGESVPVDKVVGNTVFAGTVNQHAVLQVQVTTVAAHSTLARMIQLVTDAQSKRSPSERFSDWFGERYTVVVLIGSVLGLIGFLLFGFEMSDALYRAATLLVVASPCAIVISVPAAILSALAASARQGALFKGGAALELLGHVDIVAFDKTGTLTTGKMSVQKIVSVQGTEAELLALAAGLESHSEHPIAQSIVAHAAAVHVAASEIKDTKAIPGKGIVGMLGDVVVWAGNRSLLVEQGVVLSRDDEIQLRRLEEAGQTVVTIGVGDKATGFIAVADSIRPSAQLLIAELLKAGINRIVLLSGDSETVAQSVGQELGLNQEDIYGGLLPEDKVRCVELLRTEGIVAFVGDGVNDAAALVTADVGIAMGAAGTDVAIEASDVALMSTDLTQLTKAYRLARRANIIIKQNLFFAIGIMILMVIVTVFFYLPLPLGVIGHEGGTLLVVLNGLRLLFWNK